jgi:hypothetical protein
MGADAGTLKRKYPSCFIGSFNVADGVLLGGVALRPDFNRKPGGQCSLVGLRTLVRDSLVSDCSVHTSIKRP